MELNHKIKNIKHKAYSGIAGQQRKQYCIEYQRTQTQIINQTYKIFVNALARRDQKITCEKGCCYCCFQHVWVTLGGGVAIVDYLYNNDKVMNQFLENYKKWKIRAMDISRELDSASMLALKEDDMITFLKKSTGNLSSEYLNLQIPCPFLVDSTCSIYSIRPLCCASHYSTHPPEWCSPTNPNQPRLSEFMPGGEDLYKLAELAEPRLTLYQVTMPSLVNNLLTEDISNVIKNLEMYSH